MFKLSEKLEEKLQERKKNVELTQKNKQIKRKLERKIKKIHVVEEKVKRIKLDNAGSLVKNYERKINQYAKLLSKAKLTSKRHYNSLIESNRKVNILAAKLKSSENKRNFAETIR